MIHTVNDFFNKVASDIKSKFFPNENHGTSDNEKYRKSIYAIELFNNGCLTYRQLILRLSKSCDTDTTTIHSIVENHILSFGSYIYTPKKNKMAKSIKGKFIEKVTIIDSDTGNEVNIDIYKLETGGVIGIDSSFVETEEMIYSPFDKNVEINID